MLQRILVVVGLIIVFVVGAVFGQDVVGLLSDPAQIRETILGLGPLAPMGLIILSAVQIVVAPIPGYLVQVAGGYLFGPIEGSIYGLIGMLLGAAVAFLLARHFGVPFLERFVPPRLVDGWLHLRRANSTPGLAIVLLLPVGDFCYFLAGLTSLSLGHLLALTLLIRGPSVFVAAFAGEKVAHVPKNLLGVLLIAVIVITAVVLWQRERLEMLMYDRLLARYLQKSDERNGEGEQNGDGR